VCVCWGQRSSGLRSRVQRRAVTPCLGRQKEGGSSAGHPCPMPLLRRHACARGRRRVTPRRANKGGGRAAVAARRPQRLQIGPAVEGGSEYQDQRIGHRQPAKRGGEGQEEIGRSHRIFLDFSLALSPAVPTSIQRVIVLRFAIWPSPPLQGVTAGISLSDTHRGPPSRCSQCSVVPRRGVRDPPPRPQRARRKKCGGKACRAVHGA